MLRTRFRFLAAVLAVSALPIAGGAAQASRDTSLSGNYLAGRSATQARDSETAARYLAAAIKQDPGNPALIEQLFVTRLGMGALPEAERLADDVISFNSQQRMARVVLGLKEFRNRRYEKARENFAESAYTPIGELTSALLSAWAYAGEGSLNAALKELDKLDSNESFANFKSFHSALIADYLGSAMRADGFYKKAFQDAGTSLRVTQAYGNYLERNGRNAEAISVYEKFLAGGETNAVVEKALEQARTGRKPEAFITTPASGAGEAMFSLAAAMNDDQSIDVALLYAQLAAALSTHKPVMLTLLGDIQAGTQRYDAAIATYEKVEPQAELRTNAETEISVNLQRLERPKEAEERLRKIVEREPKNFEVWVTLGNLLRNNEDFAGAVKAYDSALALLPKPEKRQWSVFYYRGISNERTKNWPAAEADFRKALELSPDEPSVLNYLGYSLIDGNQKLDEAIAMVKKAVELKPNDGYIVDSLGWAFFQLGQFDEAVVHLERAVDLRPGDAIIAEHLGDAYWRVGRKLEATFQWQHAKDNKPEPDDLKRIEGKLVNGMPDLPPPVKPAQTGTTGGSNG